MEQLALQDEAPQPWRCMKIHPKTHMPCNRSYATQYNLERHHNNIHKSKLAIIAGNVGAAGALGGSSYSLTLQAQQQPLSLQVQSRHVNQELHQQLRNNGPSQVFSPAHQESHWPQQADFPPVLPHDSPCVQQLPSPFHTYLHPVLSKYPGPSNGPLLVKRPRLEGSREKQHVPMYTPELSKKNGKIAEPRQMKGVGWVAAKAKARFEERHRELLARWGRTPGDGDACLLLPADWTSLEPTEIIELMKTKKFPNGSESRVKFSHQDYDTQHSRALAWFSEWPRSGAQLDNLVGCREYKPMDGSHPCHHANCIIHCLYETAEENEDRKLCCSWAKQQRKEGKDVPTSCLRHKRPCLLVNASLSTEEAYRVQFWIYCRAAGLTAVNPPRRPPWHAAVASTFEWKLPLLFSPDSLTFDAPARRPPSKPARNPHQPSLVCEFCEKIVSYSTISHLWSHFIHFHRGIDQSKILQEITRTGSKWKVYLQSRKLYGQDGRTLERIKQTQQGDFDWDIVLGWGLR